MGVGGGGACGIGMKKIKRFFHLVSVTLTWSEIKIDRVGGNKFCVRVIWAGIILSTR